MEDLDAILVRRWQSGIDREQVFQEIYERYYPKIFGFFRRRGFSEDESGDLTQESFLRIYSSLGSFRYESSLARWIFMILGHVYKNELRRLRAKKREGLALDVPIEEISDEALPSAPADDALDEVLGQEQRKALALAISRLPPKMRYCAMLRFESGLRYREIAIILRISIDTVKAHLAQARQNLSRELANFAPEGKN